MDSDMDSLREKIHQMYHDLTKSDIEFYGALDDIVKEQNERTIQMLQESNAKLEAANKKSLEYLKQDASRNATQFFVPGQAAAEINRLIRIVEEEEKGMTQIKMDLDVLKRSLDIQSGEGTFREQTKSDQNNNLKK